MFSGPASRCGQSPDSRALPGDSDRKAERTGARTCGMRKEARATAKALARLSARPLCKRWRVHLPVSCDKKSGVSRDVPFPGPWPAVEVLRSSWRPSAPHEKPPRKGAWFAFALEVLRSGPDDDLVDFHVGWLLDGVSDGASDRVGRNSHFHKLAQILSGCLVRAALGELRGNSTWRDHCAPDILGMQFHAEPFSQG